MHIKFLYLLVNHFIAVSVNCHGFLYFIQGISEKCTINFMSTKTLKTKPFSITGA